MDFTKNYNHHDKERTFYHRATEAQSFALVFLSVFVFPRFKNFRLIPDQYRNSIKIRVTPRWRTAQVFVLRFYGSRVSGEIYPQISQIMQILLKKIGEICEICGCFFALPAENGRANFVKANQALIEMKQGKIRGSKTLRM